jgi:hypothetical protein
LSCPDWTALAARRHAEPGGWSEAVRHFDACALCRRDALAADPLLVFRRLPVAELTPSEERSEVERNRQAVAAMRTAERLELRRFAGWRRWGAAAVLALAALSVGRGNAYRSEQAAAIVHAPASPALEGVNRPGARVYHMTGEGISVTMVFDESLDV